MNKNDVISEAIAAIPAWLSFLDIKEAEQQAILAEITQSEAGAGDEIDTAVSAIDANPVQEIETDDAGPLAWLDSDAPPPAGEPQQPMNEPSSIGAEDAANDDDNGKEETPPWAE
jgi:hypothetical protein